MISTITLDTYKQKINSDDAFDLSDSFNGRVGDEQVPLVVQFKERGLAQQFQDGLVPFITGFVGSLDENGIVTAETGEAVSYVGSSDDIVGLGRVKMNLPGTIFPQEGYFYGFFGLQNADGKRVTTFSVWFHVYNGNPDMFVNKAPFRTELQKLLDEGEATIDQYKKQLNSQISTVTQSYTNIQATVLALTTQLDGLAQKIKDGNVVTNADLKTWSDQFNATVQGKLDGMTADIDNFATNSSDAYITNLKILLKTDWQESTTSGWYPQGFSVNNDKNELYLSTEITGGTETRIEIHDLKTGELKGMKSFVNEANSFSEGIPYFYNANGELCFIVSVVNDDGYAIFNYDTGKVGDNIPINGKFKWGVEGNNFVATEATPGKIAKYSVYAWDSIQAGKPLFEQDVYVEPMGNLDRKPQGITMSNGKVYLTMGAYGTKIALQAYDIDGKIVTKAEFSKSGLAQFINENYPNSITDVENYLLEAEGAYTLDHTLMLGVVANGKFYLMAAGRLDGTKIQTNIPQSNEKTDSQLLDDGQDILGLPSGQYEGSNFKNGPLTDGDSSLLRVRVETNTAGRKVLTAVQSYSGNQWTKTVHTDGKGGSGDWLVTTGATFTNTTIPTENEAKADNLVYYVETRGYFAKHVELRINKLTNLSAGKYITVGRVPAEVAPMVPTTFVIPAYSALSSPSKYISLWVTAGGVIFAGTTASTETTDQFSAAVDWIHW